MTRIKNTFEKLKKENRKAFISFITGGDPDYETSLSTLKELPENGVDIIELGIPFLDPAGDGPTIEAASRRAIENGMNLRKILQMVMEFRKINHQTPIILMGYYNPLLHYGLNKFAQDAKKSGVDGLLIVDVPIEEDRELIEVTKNNQLDLIKLITPTSSQSRIKKITSHSSGFLYFVSILGITGTKSSNIDDNTKHIAKIKKISNLPVAIGFGIKEPKQARQMIKSGADGIVVGSSLVNIIAQGLKNDLNNNQIKKDLLSKAKEFAVAINKSP